MSGCVYVHLYLSLYVNILDVLHYRCFAVLICFLGIFAICSLLQLFLFSLCFYVYSSIHLVFYCYISYELRCRAFADAFSSMTTPESMLCYCLFMSLFQHA